MTLRSLIVVLCASSMTAPLGRSSSASAQESPQPRHEAKQLEKLWSELAEGMQWVDYQVGEVALSNLEGDWPMAIRLEQALEAIHGQPSSPDSEDALWEWAEQVSTRLVESAPEVKPFHIVFDWRQRGGAWLYSTRVKGSAGPGMQDVSTPTVSATSMPVGSNTIASIGGPLQDSDDFHCARPEDMFRSTGWPVGPGLSRAEMERVHAVLGSTDFIDDVAAGERVSTIETGALIRNERNTAQVQWTGAATYERRWNYLPTVGRLLGQHADTPVRLSSFGLRYSPRTFPLPMRGYSLTVHPLKDLTYSINVRVWALHRVRWIVPGSGRVAIELPKEATIEDRTSHQWFNGTADQPQFWPEHWHEAFRAPGVASRERTAPMRFGPFRPDRSKTALEEKGTPISWMRWFATLGLATLAVVVLKRRR